MSDEMMYNDPIGGTASEIGSQLTTYYYQKKALIEMKKEQFFSQLADTVSMPKNMGKTIKRFHYLPLLDDANINDQGIDANSVTADNAYKEAAVVVTMDDGSIPNIPPYFGTSVSNKVYFTGIGANDAAAVAAAAESVRLWIVGDTAGGGLGLVANDVTAAELAITGAAGDAYVLGYRFANKAGVTLTGVNGLGTDLEASAVPHSGNLYGSSKDIGTISGKLPTLTETGGRVNRVGFKRIELEANITKYGFFDEYTQESLDFDSDADLEMHINREMLFGANELTEDKLQIDLLNAAGVVRYAGAATSLAGMSGVAATLTEVDYDDLSKLSISLDNNRCPKHTKVITGSRMVDTKTIPSARVMYIGSELQPTIERMTDFHAHQAFIPVQQYASAGTILNGEIGTIGSFRVCVVPEMMHHDGSSTVGIAEDVNAGYRVTGGKYNAYPMLVVGSESFTTIGFQTSGKSVKFKIYHKKPGEQQATTSDPYGETGFMSIKWYYGFMALRPERIAVLWSVARW